MEINLDKLFGAFIVIIVASMVITLFLLGSLLPLFMVLFALCIYLYWFFNIIKWIREDD